MLVALSSLLLGALLNEVIRRSNRIESYSATVFQKRFTVYENLWRKLRASRQAANEIIEDMSLTPEQRHEYVSSIVLDMAEFCDDNDLYLNQEVVVHCCTVFMGVEDILADLNEADREELISKMNDSYSKAIEIVRAESGMGEIDKLFRSVTRAKYTSPAIEYFRKIQAEHQLRARSKKN